MNAALLILAAYIACAVVAARIIGRLLRAWEVREWPSLHRDGWKPDNETLAMTLSFSVFWPITLPVTYLHTKPKRAVQEPNSALAVFLFGAADSERSR